MAAEILKMCMTKGFLLDKETLDLLSNLNESGAQNVINALAGLALGERVITRNLFDKHFEKLKNVLTSSGGFDEIDSFFSEMGYVKPGVNEEPSPEVRRANETGKIKLLSVPAFPQKKITVQDFVKHFRNRYNALKSILEGRDFDDLTSIRKVGQERGSYTIIAAVNSKRTTKNKNILIEVEDLTGTSIVLVNQNKKEVFAKAVDLLPDDIVAFSVSGTKEIMFANDIFFPDCSLPDKKYSEFDEYVVFAGDFHAGSTMFLEENVRRFIKWLNGEEGDESQKALAKKVKYLLLTGDNVDGVSHYPGQEKFLNEKTSIDQYAKVESLLKLIRKDIQIIMCPGQHDLVWVGEPQPIISERFAMGLHDMENLHLVPNPSLIEIDGGFKILMYHGASINRFIDEIPDIRTNFGHTSPTRVVQEMLKRRHLAPIHGAMDYIPCENSDPMVISQIPDIIATADQHRPEIALYNNILMVASSCWQSITPFEEKVGNIPDPCKVPLFNLKTREIKLLDFSDVPKEIEWCYGDDLACKLKPGEKDGSS
jgi:DNA polymerase II small subunit